MRSIAVMRSLRIVKRNATRSSRSCIQIAPGSAVDTCGLGGLRAAGEVSRDRLRAFDTGLKAVALPVCRAAHRQHRRIGAQRCARIEQREQRGKISQPRGLEKRAHEFVVPVRRDVTAVGRAAHAPPRAAGELPRCLGRLSDDRRDVVEGHVEEIVQHERDALGRLQRIDQDLQGRADRIGEHRFFLRAFAAERPSRRCDADRPASKPRAGFATFQRVEADARDDGREPAVEIRNLLDVGAADAQPTLLQRIVGSAADQDPNMRSAMRSQARSSRFKAFREACHVSPFSIRHRDRRSTKS